MAEARGPPVAVNKPAFNWSKSDRYAEWKAFRTECEMLFRGTYRTTPANERAGAVINWMGREGQAIAATWTQNQLDERFGDVARMFAAFEDRFRPEQNEMLAEFQFRQMKRENRSSDEFMSELRSKAKDCNFGAAEDRNIKSQFILGISDCKMQEKLLEEVRAGTTVDGCLQITRNLEAMRMQLDLVNQPANQFDEVRKNKNPDCKYCLTEHKPRQCPAYGKTCQKCGRRNHSAKACKTKEREARRKKNVDEVEAQENEEESHWTETKSFWGVVKFDSVTDEAIIRQNDYEEPGKRKRLIGAILTITKENNTKMIHYKIDTGADSNLMSWASYKKLFPRMTKEDLEDSIERNTKLEACNGGAIEQLGTCRVKLKFKGKEKICHFYIVPGTTSLIGLPDAESLKLISANIKKIDEARNLCDGEDKETLFVKQDTQAEDMRASKNLEKEVMREHADLFTGVGCLEGKVHIHLKEGVTPYQAPPRRVAYSMQDPLKEELDRLVKENILVKLDADTKSEWCNSFVCRPKPAGGIRLCLDPAKLNAAIIRPVHRSKTMDDIKPKLEGAQYFSILDLKSGFWNLELDYESSLKTTFATMHGRYRYTRLPFGLNCAGDLFQKRMDEVLEGVENVVNIADDIVVFGRSGQEHDNALQKLLRRAAEKNIKFGKAKCRFRVTCITFFGEMISCYGVKPDPRKIEAILKMKRPENKNQTRSFLGHVNYMSKFSPALAEVVKPLRDIIKIDASFSWNQIHEEAYERTKKLLAKDANLQYYRRRKKLYLEVDASQTGLGAALLQRDGTTNEDEDLPDSSLLRPIAYASKSLTDTEQRYSNIEREALAILHGLEKFHHYAYARETQVITDHRPLLAIFKKDVATASPRLQRIMMRIHQYHVNLHYRPGSTMHIADCMSRVGLKKDDKEIDGLKITIDDVSTQADIDVVTMEEIRHHTSKDETLMEIMKFTQLGWPNTSKTIDDADIRKYYNFREEIGSVNGILLKGTRIIIPSSLRAKVLDDLHFHHLGIEKTRNLARTCVFWNGICEDIKRITESCRSCQEEKPTQLKAELIPHEVPCAQWNTLGIDVFYVQKQPYLCIVDYFSKFPIVRRMERERSTDVVDILKDVFSEYGIPRCIVSDAGSNFTSEEFKTFARRLGIKLKTTSSYHHASNGQVENCVKTIKSMMKKCDGQDYRIGLLMLRNTPITGMTKSPAEILQGRKLKTILPQASVEMTNEMEREEIIIDLHRKQELMKKNHDRRSGVTMRPEDTYQKGERVMVQKEDQGPWTEGIILEKNEDHNDRSYKILVVATKRNITRNVKHIRKLPTPLASKATVEDEDNTLVLARPRPSPDIEMTNEVGQLQSTEPTQMEPMVDTMVEPMVEPRRSQRTIRAPKRLDL